ncbi:hypothetical protein IU459_33670 [Nocardia amamiensis]|uniref:DUF8175 domain-containing protein n=1 Tax=Nocardia amamiensis TaxID=404578 RepID=A0ABS0D0T4_9NOCA|nr:hypothetical protein [Nocardia amamiensis]
MGGCGHDDSEHPPVPAGPDLAAAPADVRWVNYQGVRLPVGADGPRNIDPSAATGFSHSPQGAALAAIVHTVRMSLAPDEHWASIAAHEIAAGAGKDAWASSRVLLSIQTPADPATAPRVRGYTLTDYNPATARVEIYTSFPDGSIAVNTATVVWVAADWRLRLPDPDATEPAVREAATLDAVVRLEAPQ